MHALLEADAPSALLDTPEQTGIAGLETVSFRSRDGLELAAWYVAPANGASIIVTHGTTSDRSTMLAELRVLTQAGYGVLAFDWPGLGKSAGTVRWDGQAQRALTAAIDWLSARNEVDPRRIGGLGFSIGGFVMSRVAARDPRLRAVVLEASPPSFEDYLSDHSREWGRLGEWAGRWAVRDSGLLDAAAEPVKLIGTIAPRPLLFVSGTRDFEVRTALVRKLYDAARDPKALWIVDGAEHGHYFDVAPAEYARRLVDFFRVL
ncbi:MAG: alpha/beta fold hydrolase [Gammaproteobacteria bacterium]